MPRTQLNIIDFSYNNTYDWQTLNFYIFYRFFWFMITSWLQKMSGDCDFGVAVAIIILFRFYLLFDPVECSGSAAKGLPRRTFE